CNATQKSPRLGMTCSKQGPVSSASPAVAPLSLLPLLNWRLLYKFSNNYRQRDMRCISHAQLLIPELSHFSSAYSRNLFGQGTRACEIVLSVVFWHKPLLPSIFTLAKSLLIEPASVFASTWKAGVSGRVIFTEPAFVANS